MIELVLFETRLEQARLAVAAGIPSLMVDLERRDKARRQEGVDTEINDHRLEDLEVLRQAGAVGRWCRVDRWGPWSREQVEAVIERGATAVWLPMVRGVEEVEAFVDLVGHRAECGILVETTEAVAAAPSLAMLPIDAVYVGLNDLAIARRSPHLFAALADATVERLRRIFANQRFGVAGATVVDGGAPVPARLLLAELERLGCNFTFLRRSFRREIEGRDLADEITRLQGYWEALVRREAGRREDDHRDLLGVLDPLLAGRVG